MDLKKLELMMQEFFHKNLGYKRSLKSFFRIMEWRPYLLSYEFHKLVVTFFKEREKKKKKTLAGLLGKKNPFH